MKICKVHKKGSTVDVYLEDGTIITLLDEIYFKRELYLKYELEDCEIAELKKSYSKNCAYSYAINILSKCKRTEDEIRKKLYDKGYDETIITEVIREAKELGYINDRKYIYSYLSDRAKNKPISTMQIKQKLTQKGVDEDLILEVIDENGYCENSIIPVLQKKFKDVDLSDKRTISKIMNFLQYRGYSYSKAYDLISRLKSE